ncbi:MAG: cytochrome c biogenesis protein CcdA [Chromatiales bacterium]|jgi:cytochrome c-type biogenesis protein|nr:cytochrome c biogenesis protein CcdA [Chromatiales bacterium]
MISYLWAYLAGALTLINPCVLPLLPIIIAGAFQASRLGPLALACGLTLSFTIVGVGVTAFGHLAGIDDTVINQAAAIVMLAFGVVLLVPKAQGLLSTMASPFAGAANDRINTIASSGVVGQFLIGVLLGAVWSPCVGPTLGGAIGLAASGDGLTQATITMVMFGLGISTILVALSYGSRELLAARRQTLMKWMPHAKTIMGVALILVGMAVLTHFDRVIEATILDWMPIWLQDLSISV